MKAHSVQEEWKCPGFADSELFVAKGFGEHIGTSGAIRGDVINHNGSCNSEQEYQFFLLWWKHCFWDYNNVYLFLWR